MKKTLFYIFYCFCTVALVWVVLELASRHYIRKHFNEEFPLFWNPPINQAGTALDATFANHAHNIIDPHLGTLWNSTEHERYVTFYKYRLFHSLNYIPGFVYFGDPSIKNDLVIVALGGSTTQAPWYPFSWPEFLYRQLEMRGIKALVYNGGVAGFTSNQELFKLIRDGLELKPNMVISYDGINDVGFLYSVSGHPMVTPYQKQLMEYLIGMEDTPRIMPNLVYAVRHMWLEHRKAEKTENPFRRLAGINLGPEVNTTPPEQWLRNQRTMNAVCTEFGVKYFVFLQPTMGAGKYMPNASEQSMFQQYLTAFPTHNYLQLVNDFYSRALLDCKQHSDYCSDFTNIFADKSGLYTDPRHVNPAGNKIIAEAIADYILNHWHKATNPENSPEMHNISKPGSMVKYHQKSTIPTSTGNEFHIPLRTSR